MRASWVDLLDAIRVAQARTHVAHVVLGIILARQIVCIHSSVELAHKASSKAALGATSALRAPPEATQM
jgi:hypothetical protein